MAQPLTKCVICEKSGGPDIVVNPDKDCLEKLKDYAIRRALFGESKFAAFCDRITSMSDSEFLNSSYHSSCYKNIVHITKLKRAEARYNEAASTSKVIVPPKRGRPSSTDSNKPEVISLRRRSREKVESTRCVFPCEHPESGDLHRVMSASMGEKLIFIKQNTPDDHVKVALATVNEPLDCVAQDLFYHRDCLREHERKASQAQVDVKSSSTVLGKYIADIDIINAVKGSLSHGDVVTVNDIEENYKELLVENGIDVGQTSQKKHLKKLISENIEDVEFVQPHRRNESAKVISKKLLGATVSELRDIQSSEDEQENVRCLSKAAAIVRKELLGTQQWKFTGTLADIQVPTKLYSFLKWVLCGTRNNLMEEKQADASKAANLICQHILTNLKTQRQATYKSKSDTHTTKKNETPLSIGLALTAHKKTRSKNLVNTLSQLQIGTNYTQIIKLEKRIACAVADRMKKTGGYCLPPFVKKDQSVFFAADNIDFLEDTAYGQNTLHGTLLVMNQRDNMQGMPINEPLEIPHVDTPVDIEIDYLHAPEIKLRPIRFKEFDFNSQEEVIRKYETQDLAWFMASYAHREKPISEESQNAGEDEPMDISFDSEDDTVYQSEVLETCVEAKVSKKDIMPTWAATNSLLIQFSSPEASVRTVNTGIVAPLLRRPPTDYGSLYTVLCLAQGISSVVVGPHRKTVITLDLDLYERALKLQSSTGNTDWFLRAGELHICFASLHALGKYIEGSGLDAINTEAGLYSPATIRQIFAGKSYKRGVEYHITNVLACYELLFDSWRKDRNIETLLDKCKEFREKLHSRDIDAYDTHEYICLLLRELQDDQHQEFGEMAVFLRNYMKQVDSLLRLIRGSRQGDFLLYLGALEEQVKYYFAHDLYKYARLIPVHLAQTIELQTTDPETWNALAQGDFVVARSKIPFTNLFVDQTLEQKIRELKVAGGVTGITQQEEALNRYFLIAPELTQLVAGFLQVYSAGSSYSKGSKEHYQLAGSVAVRIFNNAAKIKDGILKHCQGNPFSEKMHLMNIVSNMTVSEKVKSDILDRDQRGAARFREFVSTRILASSADKSVWDPIEKMKLKVFSTSQKKTPCKVSDKLVKLREDRQLLARFLVVQQSRPELGQNLGDAIGIYEFSVIPKSLFSADGQMLIPTDKSSFIKLIENFQEEIAQTEDGHPQDADQREKVCIIDAMAIVQAMKKGPGMETCADFAETFVQSITKIMKGYTEGRVIFDRYIEDSLKSVTRKKRAGGIDPVKFMIHDSTNIKLVQLKTLLSHTETKAQLTEYLGKALLQVFSKRDQSLVVVYGTSTFANKPDLFDQRIVHHTHEEADTLIPLHVLDAASRNGIDRDVDVYSPDTDVMILLMDLACNHQLHGKLNLVTGRGNTQRKIDIERQCFAITVEKSKGLVGLHAYSGADWGGKFAGVSKKRWLECYLDLEKESEIVDTFQRLGQDDFDQPRDLLTLEKFTCSVYAKSSKHRSLQDLRWELFKTKNLQDERLPPTLATLEPHVSRVHVIATIWKGYKTPKPQIPPLVGNGWEISADGSTVPVRCLKLPAPQAIIQLVKCGCRGQCSHKCSCVRNNLSCTSLCKCNDCSNTKDYVASFVEDEDIEIA